MSPNMHWTMKNPSVGTDPIPVERYTSQEYFQQERKKVFQNSWLNIGRAAQIPKPGDFFVHDFPLAKTSILVVRTKGGQINAFHNMCSHRGNPVMWEKRGNCRGYFTCRFHGWVYDTSGELMHVTDEGNFPSVKKSENSLTSIHCDVWQGFIFVHLGQTPQQSLADYLAPVTMNVDGYPFDAMEPSFSYRIHENVNWKILSEAQLEGWHLPFLHPNTLAKAVKVTGGKTFRHASLERLGVHGLCSSPAPDTYEPSPVGLLSVRYGVGTMDAFASKSTMDLAEKATGPKWRGAFDFWHIFPNMFLGLLNGTYFTFNVWPVAIDQSMWEIKGYYPPVKNAGQLFAREFSKIGLRDPMMEDSFAHEKIQSVLASGAKKSFHLQDEELAVRHFTDMVNQRVIAE